MNIKTLKMVMPYLFNAKITPLIIGHKGQGKTESVQQIAKDLGYEFVSIKLGNLQDTADLLGLFDFYEDEFGVKRCKYARPDFWPTNPNAKVIIFFDELARANRMLLQPVMELALEGRHHTYILPENCRVVLASNPLTDEYIQGEGLDDFALLERVWQCELSTDSVDLSEYLLNERKLDPYMVSFLKERPGLINDKMNPIELKITKSPRKWKTFMEDVIQKQTPPEDIARIIGEGWVGYEAYAAFSQHMSNKPTFFKGEEIANNYEKLVKPKLKLLVDSNNPRPDLITHSTEDLLAYTSTLKELSSKHIKNINKYFMELPDELLFGAMQQVQKYPKDEQPLTHNLRNAVDTMQDLLEKVVNIKNATVKVELAKTEVAS